MEVKLQSSITITLPHFHPNFPETPLETPFSIFDRLALDCHVAVIYAFTPQPSPHHFPTNAELIDGLQRTLHHFPQLTAKLLYGKHQQPHSILIAGGPENGGALVVEATVDSPLCDLLPLEPSRELMKLHPDRVGAAHVLQIQINRFRCGGIVTGGTFHHKVADGLSMGNFFAAWGQTVRGLSVDPLPVHDRSWLAPRTPPRCEFEHFGVDFLHTNDTAAVPTAESVDPSKINNIMLHYSSDFIAKLKSRLKGKYTTFETLLAHVWKKMTIARRLEDDETTLVGISVNGRPRMSRVGVSREFFGNLVLNAYPKCSAKDLVAGEQENVARIIHEAIMRIGEEYFQSIIDFEAVHKVQDIVPFEEVGGNVLMPFVDVVSWLRFRFQEIDFGGGARLCGFLPSWLEIEGLVIFVHALDGIDVVVTLLEEHAETMRKIAHSFD